MIGLYSCVIAIFLLLQGEGGVPVSPGHGIYNAVLYDAASQKEERVPPSCRLHLGFAGG